MPRPRTLLLPDELFLVDVEDPLTGSVAPALAAARSPAMLMTFAATHFTEAASRHFKAEFDLGAVDWRMVFLFAREPGATAAHAWKTHGLDKGAVSRSIQRLEANGLLVGGPLHANGRSRGWHLTRQGHAMHRRILKVALERQKRLLEGFGRDEVEAFCDYLVRFMRNLDALAVDPGR